MLLMDAADKVPILTSEDGLPIPLSEGDRRFVRTEPDAAIVTTERARHFPNPQNPAALDAYHATRDAYHAGDGYQALRLAEKFRQEHGWFGPAEMYRILAREAASLLYHADLIELIAVLNAWLHGKTPEEACPLDQPAGKQHLEWLLGMAKFNLAETLRKEGLLDEALAELEGSFLGVTNDERDHEALAKRLILKSYLLRRLNRPAEADNVETEAKSLGQAYKSAWDNLKLEIDDLE